MQRNSRFEPYNLFYELVRLSLCCKEKDNLGPVGLSSVPSKKDWQSLFTLAKKQALVGVCLIGVQRLYESSPEQTVNLPSDLCLQWVGLSLNINRRNELLNQRCLELQSDLAEAGFRTCILKGQGNLQYYPEELRLCRQSGDIDVWLWCDGDLRQRRKRIIDYARTFTPDAAAFYHHVDCGIFDDVPVELHYLPSWFNNPFVNRKFLRWCEENGPKETKIGSERIVSPSIRFNLVYQLVHLYQHLFLEGIGLRQLMDYYMLLNAVDWTDKQQIEDVERTLKTLKLERFTSAVMWVLSEVFGLESEKMLFTPDKKEGVFLLCEIEQAGNFGHHDRRLSRKGKGLTDLFIMHTRRNLHFIAHYPGESLWSPLFKFWHWGWRSVCLH